MTRDSLNTIVDDRTTRLFEVYDGTSTAYVWGTSNEDAQNTCYVQSYLDDDSHGEWEIAEVQTYDRDYATAQAEADRRHDALHGR